jgi:hypothetical protein
MMLIQIADQAINAGTAVHEPSKGQSAGNRSGKAELALQQQADLANSSYLDNFSAITLPCEAKILLDAIPRIYDRPGRIARILGIDDTESRVILNQPFMTDPQSKRPVPYQQPETPAGMPPPPLPKEAKHYDLTKGVYSVTVSVGKSWQTRMQQGADEIGQILQAAPTLLPIIGDIYFKFRDFPGHTEISERLKKMLPPPVQAMLAEGQAPDAQQLQQQLSQAQQQMQQLQQQLQQAMQVIETEQAKQQADTQRTQRDLLLQEREFAQADRDREDQQRHEMALEAAKAQTAATQAARAAEQAESQAENADVRASVSAEQAAARESEPE